MTKFTLAVVITLAVLAAGITKIADLDFWWQMKAGQLVVENRAVPRADVFSYTAQGHEYVDHEWLFQVIQYATYSVAGPAGIALLKCLLVSLTLLIIALHLLERGVDPWLIGGLVLLSIAGGITRMIERPVLFSTLFAVITFVICATSANIVQWYNIKTHK